LAFFVAASAASFAARASAIAFGLFVASAKAIASAAALSAAILSAAAWAATAFAASYLFWTSVALRPVTLAICSALTLNSSILAAISASVSLGLLARKSLTA
jgi:hypothetical protein